MSCRAARSSLRAYPLSMGSKAGSKFLFAVRIYRKTASPFSGGAPGGIGIARRNGVCARPAKLEAPALEPGIVFRDVADNRHHGTMG